MPVVLSDLLEESHVILDLTAATRDAALRQIIATMAGEGKLPDAEAFLAEVRAREEVQSTLMGRGVAFPHARTNAVSDIVLGIGRSREGVPFGPGGELAHLLFVVAVPQRRASDYLACVGSLARLARDEQTRAALDRAETPAEFVELLRIGSVTLL